MNAARYLNVHRQRARGGVCPFVAARGPAPGAVGVRQSAQTGGGGGMLGPPLPVGQGCRRVDRRARWTDGHGHIRVIAPQIYDRRNLTGSDRHLAATAEPFHGVALRAMTNASIPMASANRAA